MPDRGSWRVDERTGEVVEIKSATEALEERAKRLELERRELLKLSPSRGTVVR